jgi:hypothetical protein
VASNNDDDRRTAPKRQTGDPELDAQNERMHVEWEARRVRDQETAVAIGKRVVAHVETELKATEIVLGMPIRMPKGPWATETELDARRSELSAAASAAKQKHAGIRYKTPDELQAAVREQCAAEFGRIMGHPFNPKDVNILGRNADHFAPLEKECREIYTNLRTAMTKARDMAYRLPNGSGGPAGRALFYMRGILPVLPDLTEPPFDAVSRPGRSAFVREWEDLGRRLRTTRSYTDRDLAVISLLWGYCPRESYPVLLRDGEGMTVADVIAEEAKCVARVRKKDSPGTPT